MSLVKGRIVGRLLAIAFLGALTAGCFQPMYAERTVTGEPALREKLSAVDVTDITTAAVADARLGVELRNGLLFSFTGGSSPAPPTHKLVVRMSTSRTSAIVDVTTSRPDIENYGIDVSYELREIATNKPVMRATDLCAGVVRYSGTGAALRAYPRPARRREPGDQADRREHQPAPVGILCRGHLKPRLLLFGA